MSISFACQNCGKSFTVDAKFAGKKGRCKQCGAMMPIPETGASKSPARPPHVEVSPSRRVSASAASPAAAPNADVFGFEDTPSPAQQGLPVVLDENDSGLIAPKRVKPRSAALYDRPKSSKNKSEGSGVFKLVIRIALGIGLGLGGLTGGGLALMNSMGVSTKGTLEAIIQERVSLNQQLAQMLAGVTDVPSAESTSPQAVKTIKAITANLRKLKNSKGLKTDLEALKQQYQGPQLQAEQQAVQHLVRIATIPGAWDALNVQASLEELDGEEKSIPGRPQVPAPLVANPPPVMPRPAPNREPQPGPNPGPGANRNRPPNNRPNLNPRKGANRPNFDGPG